MANDFEFVDSGFGPIIFYYCSSHFIMIIIASLKLQKVFIDVLTADKVSLLCGDYKTFKLLAQSIRSCLKYDVP